MITFLELGSFGRLGNQLFQYAALKALGLANGYEVKIPHPSAKEWHGQKCFLDQFNINSPYIEKNDLESLKYLYIEKNPDKLDENFFSTPNHTNIQGYFQNLFYFEKFNNQIKKELTPKDYLLLEAQENIKKIKKEYPHYEIVSVHMRRGDLVDMEHRKSAENLFGSNNGDLKKDSYWAKYFLQASKSFKNKKVKFLVFSGGQRGNEDNTKDISWCKDNLKDDHFIFSEGNSPMQDFSLIMSCDHNILSPGSSFGWWAAYLNKNDFKTVIAPFEYHPDEIDKPHKAGFYPKNWKILSQI
tara:strand:- start:305 stop:1201 length:897 start_codon:yes stop_codon:yes gene_type:complete